MNPFQWFGKLLVVIVICLVAPSQAMGPYTYKTGDLNECNLITDTKCKFSVSDYSAVVNAFGKGMKLSSKYTLWTACETSLNQMVDDFNLMNVNNTISEADWEGRLVFLNMMWSKSYADTMYNCFMYMKQVQKKSVDKNKSFLDDNDRFTSFLFNMLSQSYDIRKYSYQLIAFSRKPYRWVEYAEAIGKITYSLVYFDSSMASPLTTDDVNNDNESPYFYDKEGNLQLKMRIEHNPDLQKPLPDDEDEQMMDAETQASEYDQSDDEMFYYDSEKENSKSNEYEYMSAEYNHTRNSEYYQHLMVQDKHLNETLEYNFTIFSFINITFGVLDGALNAMPRGGLLQKCGEDSKLQRAALIQATDFYQQNDLTNMVLKVYISMQYQYTVFLYCWYGLKSYTDGDYLIELITEGKIIENFLFNIGYMWTDVIMLVVGKPGKTESDYAYYVGYYVGDFLFRWIFRQEGDGNCWYPWVVCDSITSITTTINEGVTTI